jgi:hypothetical protein
MTTWSRGIAGRMVVHEDAAGGVYVALVEVQHPKLLARLKGHCRRKIVNDELPAAERRPLHQEAFGHNPANRGKIRRSSSFSARMRAVLVSMMDLQIFVEEQPAASEPQAWRRQLIGSPADEQWHGT